MVELRSMILCAAHKAARVASESLVMNEMRVHVVITDVPKSDQRHESSVVNVPSRAGQARFRAAALSQRCSFVNRATRSLVCGLRWLPNLYRMGEGQARRLDSSSARGSHRSRGGGTESNPGRVNWGTSGGRRPVGITTETGGGSQKLGCGHSKQRHWRTEQPLDEPRTAGRERPSRHSARSDGAISPNNRTIRAGECLTRAGNAYKPLRVQRRRWRLDNSFEAVLGKTHRTEF